MRASVWFDDATLERELANPATTRRRTTDTPSWKPAPKAPTVQLERGSIFSKPLEEGERLTVLVTFGHAWVTMENDARDYVLSSNEALEFAGPGLLVIEGLEQGARVQFGIAP